MAKVVPCPRSDGERRSPRRRLAEEEDGELRELAERDGWLDKLVYLLYELDITEEDARRFPSDLRGVSLQSPLSAKTNRTMHPVFAALQQANAGAP